MTLRTVLFEMQCDSSIALAPERPDLSNGRDSSAAVPVRVTCSMIGIWDAQYGFSFYAEPITDQPTN